MVPPYSIKVVIHHLTRIFKPVGYLQQNHSVQVQN